MTATEYREDLGKHRVYAHFIGVGGAGMSGLALVLLQRGRHVTGSDMKESRFTHELADAGMTVAIGHDAANLPDDVGVVVVSTAIPETNPELREARRRNIPVWQRARMLAHLTEGIPTVAVAGTHGKTSTSSMLASSLGDIGADPGFCIGGQVSAYGTNAAQGAGRLFVVEADESDGSFIHLTPHIALITNIERDHVDHYGSIDDIRQAFRDFIALLDAGGVVLACGDDADLLELVRASGKPYVTYGCGSGCDVRFSDVKREGLGSRFTVQFADVARLGAAAGNTVQAGITLPGVHMVSNATSVLAACALLGLDVPAAAAALAQFAGVHRRFELVGEHDGVTVIDDYGHHPTEIAATLGGIKQLGFERLVVVFQPHRYSRTEAFLDQFADAFVDADLVVLMDVYSAGEAPIPGVSGRSIVEKILEHHPRARVAWLPRRETVAPWLAGVLRAGDALITMGAGDITGIGPEYLDHVTGTSGAAGASGVQD
ncbi:MAG: UDP-N-acetylmuramate--L-alanine ligase [Actinomycetes bacterium]|jgi:UDP-N-acetylmuramate--alanine ligase|nr:UDP-N-acetylmuramate--L-alanine ligase [Actinomycetes bacterium]